MTEIVLSVPESVIDVIADRVATIVTTEINTTTTADGRAQLLTVTEAAALLSVHRRTVSRLVERGELYAYDIAGCVRLRLTEVEEYVQRSKREPTVGSTRPSLRRQRSPVADTSGLPFAERLRCLERQ